MTYRSFRSSRAQQRGLSRGLLLAIIAGLLVVIACAVAAYFFFLRDAAGHGKKAMHVPPPQPVFVTIKPMTVNLQTSGQMLYIGVSLDVSSKKAADTLTAHMPQIRNRMLITLSDEPADTLETVKGKREVALALKKVLSQPYAGTGAVAIDKVLYTDFIVQ